MANPLHRGCRRARNNGLSERSSRTALVMQVECGTVSNGTMECPRAWTRDSQGRRRFHGCTNVGNWFL